MFPPNSTVVGIPGKVIIQDGVKIKNNSNHWNLPGPIADRLSALESEIQTLKEERERQEERSL